jgi:hypothetical protein
MPKPLPCHQRAIWFIILEVREVREVKEDNVACNHLDITANHVIVEAFVFNS